MNDMCSGIDIADIAKKNPEVFEMVKQKLLLKSEHLKKGSY